MSSAAIHVKAPGDVDRADPAYRKMFDVDGDGVGPLEEIMMKYDINGDATFSPAEVKHIIKDMEEEKAQSKNLSRIVYGLIFALIALCGVMFLVVLGGNEASKENHTEGDNMVNLDGKPVKVDTIESFATLWDLTEVSTGSLAYLKSLTLNVDMSTSDDADIAGWAEMTIKVASAYRPADSDSVVRVTSSEGYVVKLNANTESATITMGADTFELDVGEIDVDVRRRRLEAMSSSKSSHVTATAVAPNGGVELMSHEAFVKKQHGKQRRLQDGSFSGSLMTSGSFTMVAGGRF